MALMIRYCTAVQRNLKLFLLIPGLFPQPSFRAETALLLLRPGWG